MLAPAIGLAWGTVHQANLLETIEVAARHGFPTLQIPPDIYHDCLEAGTNAKVVDEAKAADAVLEFTQEAREKEILSLTGTGRVREFQLRYRVGFRVHDGRGGHYVTPSTILLTRDVTYNDAEVLAKEAEEQLLFRDMQSDMVQQIMRRLAAAERLKPREK